MMADDIQGVLEESNKETFFAEGFNDANSYSQVALCSVVSATRSCNALPCADDFSYYSSFPGFRGVMAKERKHILSMMSSLVQGMGMHGEFERREDKMDFLVDVNDLLLENVSTYLDEASGLKKSEEELVLAVKPSHAISTSWNKKQFQPSPASRKSYQLLTAKNVSRPQLRFRDKVDNSSSPFVPILKEKPNSVRPLAILPEGDQFSHPYEWEIDRFQAAEEHMKAVDPVVPKSLEDTPLVMVKTEHQLQEMCIELKRQAVFAADLEHHSYRTFQGITCLMQISTREKDYIVDVLELRSEMHILNDVFTDPKIIKVLHGADWDVLWLQRDFGLYVVGMFDTGQGARVLRFAHLSLSHLLRHYCGIEVDKRYQLADWRVRPLPAEMMKYAREDTHYLLYVYDRMRNDLIAQGNDTNNLLTSTFERSKLLCAKRYQKPVYSSESYLDLYKRSRKMLYAKQLFCLKELHAWRDVTAREQDESVAFVLPNHMLMQIAEALPREQQGVLACCNPIPPLVKQQLNEIHAIVRRASSSMQVDLSELHQVSQTPRALHPSVDLSSPVHCPHDIHHLEDTHHHTGNTDHLLPLAKKDSNSSPPLLKKRPILSLLFKKKKPSTSEHSIPQNVLESIKNLMGPYERYKVTEQLQSKDKHKKPKEENEVEMREVEVVDLAEAEEQPSLDEGVEIIEAPEEPSPKIVDENATLRKKSKKKKQKIPDPDITLIVPPPKQPPPVVTIEDEDFSPYDYSQSDCSQFSGKKQNSNDKLNSEKQFQNQNSKQFYSKKRKHAKQATYTQDPTTSQAVSGAKWPKRR